MPKRVKRAGISPKKARFELEQKTGKSVVTGENFLPPAPAHLNKKLREHLDE